jgi:putative flippase GtrA
MKLKEFFVKYKEIILYLVFGVLTTAVSIGTFALTELVGIHELVGNIISWVVSVTFAFFTNRIWVFDAKTDSTKSFFVQFVLFYLSRIATFLVEELIIFVCVTLLHFNPMVIKIIAQVIVIILNFVVSKLVVFRKKKTAKEDETTDEIKENSKEEEKDE